MPDRKTDRKTDWALVALLVMVAPAWAGTAQIQDDVHVLNAATVQDKAATLPVGVYVWVTTQDADNKATFNNDVRNKISATFPVVIGINTQSRHESIQIGPRAGVSPNAASVAESSATPGAKPTTAGITFGEDCDIDSEGHTYIADRGSNMIDIIGPDGTFANSFAAPGPVSIAWLGDGEIAVATFNQDHLVIVYDKRGHVTRDFGDPEQISDRDDLNRFLNIGVLATDAAHRL